MTTEPTPTPVRIRQQHARVADFARLVVDRSATGHDVRAHDWAKAADTTHLSDLDRILLEARRTANRPGAIRVGRTFRGAVLVVVVTGPDWTLAFRPTHNGAADILLATDADPDGPVCLRPDDRAADIAAMQRTVLRALATSKGGIA
ncbi:hypothetical protein [Longispora urticae]